MRPGRWRRSSRGTGTGCAAAGISPPRWWTARPGRCGGSQYIEVDQGFRPLRRIESRRARLLSDGAWEAAEGRERVLGETPSVAAFSLPKYRFPETMDGFIEETPPGDDLRAALGVRRGTAAEGVRGGEIYETDLHAKIAYPC